jgi:multidrug resistance efflux pump
MRVTRGLKGLQKYPLLCFLVAGLLLPCTVIAQQGTFFKERDNQYLLLGLKRAKVSFEASKSEYERQQELFAQELISEAALDRSEINYVEAEVNYQQQMLAVLFEAQYVTVQSAVKYQGEGTEKRIRLVIANAAAGSAEFKQLIEFEDELWKSL